MRRGSWKKNGTTDRGANEEEETESAGVRSKRKDPIMCMSGSQHHWSLNFEKIEQQTLPLALMPFLCSDGLFWPHV